MKKRILGTIFIVIMLGLLIIQPAVMAQSTEYEEVNVSYIRIPYGTGIDTDGDGIIDNFEEDGVEYGTEEINFSKILTSEWNKDFTYYDTTISNDVGVGVEVAGIHEQVWEIFSTANESITPTASCYTHDKVEIKAVSDVLNVVTFYMQLEPDVIMTGAQEYWYRSPLAWEDSIYKSTAHESFPINVPEHYLNIYDEDNVLIWTSPQPSKFEGNPYPRAIEDNSTENTTFKRIYYKIMMPIRPDVRYRFEEYVKTIDDNPVNSVKLYMANLQDIALDEEKDTFIFKQSPYSRLIPVECSWGAIFTVGIGMSGTEKVIFSSQVGGKKPTIDTSTIPLTGTDVIGDVQSITIILPLRTTKAIDMKVQTTVVSDGDTWVSDWITYEDITGTAILNMDISDPDNSEPNDYTFKFEIQNFNTGIGDAMTYVMFPQEGTFHILYNNTGEENNVEINFFAPLIELVEYNAPSASEEHVGAKDPNYLLGSLLMLIGGFLMVAALLIPGVTAVVMASGVIFGSISFFSGLYVAFPEQTQEFITVIKSGLARIFRGVYEGINELTGGLLDVIIQVIETVVNLGSWVLHNAGLILLAIIDIIYFITAFIVWWLTAKFLGIMTAIRKGEIDQAARQIVRVEGSLRKRTRQIIRPIKKTRKGVARIVRR
jgi:hypothetical protein